MKRLTLSTCVALLVLVVGCASNPGGISGDLSKMKGKIPAEKLLAVDCLLPPEVRNLGSQMTYLAARLPIKTIALDCEIRGGEYIAYDRANYRTALNTWLEQAKQGDAQAQTYVGEIYEKGLGLPPDYKAAYLWNKKAADQGFSRAQINLGYLYENGLGVAKDSVAALNWYRLASGVTDDIDYTSTIETRADTLAEERTVPLREELAHRESEIQQLEQSLADTQVQLNKRERSLKNMRERVRKLEQDIEQERARGADTAALERKYQEQLIQMRNQQNRVSQLQTELSDQQGRLARPSIEITEPQLLSTRSGEPILTVRSGGSAQIIKGKIRAPAGLRRASLNGRSITTDSQGFFNSAVPIPSEQTRVTIQATDNQNQTAQYSFMLVPKELAEVEEADLTADTRVANSVKFGRYYALIIGNNEYQNYERLETATNDAQRVASVLKTKYGFDTRVITNADRYTMLSAINEIKAKLREEDNLLIYYAGHGEIDQRTRQGYWLPVDAEKGNTANWIPNSAITDLLNTVSARHVLVIADSCYSGSMSGTSIPRLNTRLDESRMEKWLKTMARTKSRTVLTSGGLEPVLDSGGAGHSIFARALIERLESNTGVIDAYRIFLDVSNKVTNRASTVGFDQMPTYAPIRHAGHGGGEFVLVRG